jgi:MFS family permease
MTRLRRPFAPLHGPAYRRFFTGQAFARTSVWVQSVAELWLVLKLTGSGVSLGLTTALQFAPMLLFGAWAGLLADRLSKRRILLFAQAWMVVPAAALFVLTASGAIELWMVYLLVLARGFGHAVDNPVRQAFLSEVVEPGLIPASVSLNAALVSSARMLGPAIGGVLIAAAGVVPCFAVATAGFIVAWLALVALRPQSLTVSEPIPREPGQLRQGLRHIRSEPSLLIPLAAMAVVGTLAFNFPVLLPLMARFEFHSGAGTFGALAAAMGVGAVLGALTNASRSRAPTLADLGLLALCFGAFTALLVAAPSLPLAFAALVCVGAASTTFAATTNSLLQLGADPHLRGRVMAMFSVVYLGSTPLGGPIVGWVAEHAGARAGFAVGAVATVLTGLAILFLARGQATAWLSSACARATTLSARWAGTSS